MIRTYVCINVEDVKGEREIQRISVAEKYRPIYEKQAKENQSKAGKEYGNGGTKLAENLPQPLNETKKDRNPTTDSKLASIAGVSEKI